MKKKIIWISKVKQSKRASKDASSKVFRSKDCLASSNMTFVDVVVYNLLSKQKNVKFFVISLRDIDDQIQKNIDIFIDFKIIFFEKFHDLINVFFKIAFDELTLHREHDHKIVIKRNQKLDHSFLRKMSFPELNFVKKYFENNLKKEFIVVSHTSCSSSILLIKKSSEELKFCVDYRKLNQMIKKNRYSISLITKTFAQLSKTKIFSKINISQVFHKLRIKKTFENLIIFITKFDVYKWRVLSFELIEDSFIWQHYINDVLWNFLNDFCTTYLNDILIYSKNRKKHSIHVRKVFERLRIANFQTNINKCEFFVIEIKYFELIISMNDIRMNFAKVKIIEKWNTLINLKQVRSFIEFCIFYKRFIKAFFKIAKSLNAFVKKTSFLSETTSVM